MELIVLEELIHYLNAPDETQKQQVNKYEDEY